MHCTGKWQAMQPEKLHQERTKHRGTTNETKNQLLYSNTQIFGIECANAMKINYYKWSNELHVYLGFARVSVSYQNL